MVPCLEGLLNTAPSLEAPERENEGEISGWAHPGLQLRANTKANPHLSMKIPFPPCGQRVCVCVHLCCERMGSMCVPNPLPKAQPPSFWRMVPFHLIYLSIQKINNPLFLFSPCGLFHWRHPSFTFLSLFQFSLSHNFFQSCSPTLPSSLKLCRGHNLELQPASRNAINPHIPISV